MPIEITMPKLSDTMTEGTLVKWNKKEGDKVKPGDLIAEVETDKATQELEVFDAGTIAKIVVPEGGKTPVGGVIVVLAKPDEDVAKVKAESKATAAAPAAKESAPPAAKPAAQPTAAPTPTPAAAPAAQPAAAAPEDHEERPRDRNGKLRVSPLARKIAEEKGVDLNTVEGSGPSGRIIKKDVLAAAERPAAPAAESRAPRSAVPALPAAQLEEKTIPLSGIRQTIARRLLESKQTIPHFYVSIDVRMDQLLTLRKQANEQLAPEKLTVTDFIVRAVAVALTRLPQVNSSFTGEAIQQHGSVDLGIAVAIEEGLLVPVLRAAHTKGIRRISTEIRQLAEQARTRKLKAQDMTGSTFTISNMGMYGIKDFLAIINPPEAAILAVGATEWRPIVVDEGGNKTIKPAQIMTIALSADHRVVDGALGAQFIAELKSILEHPLTMLI